MNNPSKLLLLSGGYFLIVAAMMPEQDKETLRKSLGLPSDFGDSLLNQNAPEAEKVEQQEKPANTGVKSLPSDRVLTKSEVMEVATYVKETYGIHSTDARSLTIFAYVESSFRPWVYRDESRGRRSTGLMQTLLGTAQDMYNKGYKAVGRPTHESLKNPIISMYFGAAYLEWLKLNYYERAYSYGNYEDFFLRAYNGGAGWQNSETGRNNTAQYLKKWEAAKIKLNLPNAYTTGYS